MAGLADVTTVVATANGLVALAVGIQQLRDRRRR